MTPPQSRSHAELRPRSKATAPLLDLYVNGQTIRTTAEHPFWAKDRGWVAAHQLLAGDQLRTHDGRWLKVDGLEGPKPSGRVYNMRVAEYHTYFVGHQTWGFSVWSHNMSVAYPGSARGRGVAVPSRPPNLSPPNAGRSGAFNAAKRNSGIPRGMQPKRVLPNVDRRGVRQPGKIYEYEVPAPGGGKIRVSIRDDAGGHDFGPGNPQNRGPHFNDEAGSHYDY